MVDRNNDSGIGTFVRNWIYYNNLSSSFYKQYGAAKKVKDDYEKQIRRINRKI